MPTDEPVDSENYITLVPAKANKADAEKCVGRRLPDELFEMDQVWGRRLLIVREAGDTSYGHIIIPRNQQDAKTTGWVVAAGPLVGTPAPGMPGWSPYYANELILKRVLFGAFAGVELPVVEDPLKRGDAEFASDVEQGYEEQPHAVDRPYIIITDLDVFWSY